MKDMTNGAYEPTAFGLPSDTGGKDLGVFLPIANGGWILSKNAPKLDGSYDYNRKVARLADETGLDFIMSMAKYRGYGGETEHWRHALDSTALMAALAEATDRVKIWTTTHTLLQNPAVTAKMMATLDQISHGRAGLNVVTGAYKGEFAQMGAWPENVGHDDRYALATEWIQAIKALWTQESVTMDGTYFQLDDCMSDPKPATRPFLVCAGTSKAGMRFTSNEMDALFLSGGDIPELAASSRAAKDDAASIGRAVRTYSMMTILFGDTDAAAEVEAARYREGLDEGALHGMMRAYGFLDAEIGKENAFTAKARSTFMTPHVLGTPETVIERLSEIFAQTSLDGLMLIFPDYLTGMPIFGEHVLPVLRQRFPSRVPEPAHV
jgi:pyrimidine oxygenase